MQQGIAVARRQNAKSWELRGAMSLARLWAVRRVVVAMSPSICSHRSTLGLPGGVRYR